MTLGLVAADLMAATRSAEVTRRIKDQAGACKATAAEAGLGQG